MRKRNILLLILFIILVVLMPFIIELSYSIESPLIVWGYTQSDILIYIATVIGLIIAMTALFLTLDENHEKVEIDVDMDRGDFEFRIKNKGNVPFEITQFGFVYMSAWCYFPRKIDILGFQLPIPRWIRPHRVRETIKWKNELSFEFQPGKVHSIRLSFGEVENIFNKYYNCEKIKSVNKNVEIFLMFSTWKPFYKKVNKVKILLENARRNNK